MNVLEPGEYACVIEHPTGKRLPGTADLGSGRQPAVQVYEWPVADENGIISFPGPDERFESVRCELRQGVDLYMFDVVVQPQLPDYAWMTSKLAIAAPPAYAKADSRYHGAKVQITNGHRVFGTFPIHRVEWPAEPATTGTDRYSVHWDADANTRFRLGEVDLSAEFLLSHSVGDRYQFSLQTRPVFTFASDEPKSPIDWMNDYVEPLRDLVSLATLEPQRIAIAALTSPDNEERERAIDYTLFSREIDQAPYSPTIDVRNDGRTLFTFRDNIGNPIELLDRWQRLRADCSAFVEPLLSGLTRPGSSRFHFLSLVEALEGLHAELYGEGRLSAAEHKALRAAVLGELASTDISIESLRWIKKWLDRYGRYSLPERLSKLDSDVRLETSSISGAELRPTEIAQIRNGLSHGSREYSRNEIDPHIRAMAVVGIAHLLRLLQIPPNNISRFFGQS